jgi:HD-like signal output (HDOD) protein
MRETILERMDSVSAIPVAAAKAMRLLQDQSKNLSEAIRTIEFDPALTANILKLVNSSAFAAGRKIGSLHEATVRLGAKNILQMLIGSSMAGVMSMSVKGYDLPPGELWRSAVCGAIYTELIAEELKLRMPVHTFTAALLREIGKIVLGSFVDVNASAIVELAGERGVPFHEAEREILGIDHAEVGSLLLAKWNMPRELRNPVRWHHEPESCPEEDRSVTEIVHLADAFTMMEGIGAGGDGLNYRISDAVAEKLGLNSDVAELIICKMQLRRDQIKEFLSAGGA